MSDVAVVVVLPSEGVALALAALSRRFSSPLKVLLEEEIAEAGTIGCRKVVILELLVALLNRSPVEPLRACAERLQELGFEVVGYGRYQVKQGMDALFAQVFTDRSRETLGYLPAVQGIRICDHPLDELGRQLSEEGFELDTSERRGSCCSLRYEELPPFDETPEAFRRYLSAVVAQCS